MIISLDAKKKINKIQYLFWTETLKLRTEGKNKYYKPKPTWDFVFNGKIKTHSLWF